MSNQTLRLAEQVSLKTYLHRLHTRASWASLLGWDRPWGVLLWAILFLSLGLRLYGIGNPLLDSHAERQTQVAMVTRNLFQDGMNITCTRLDIFGNSSGCVLLEFPLIHSMTALLYFLLGEHDLIGRVISLAFSIGAIFFMHRLALLFLPPVPSLAATTLYALSPLNIYFGRAFMPESSMMFFSVAAVYYMLMYLRGPSQIRYTAAIASAILAFLAKTTAVIVLVPVVAAWVVRYQWGVFRRLDFYLYLILSLAPITIWSLFASYVNHQNADIPSGWQLESIVTGRGGLAVLAGPLFYINMGRSIVGTLLTPLGFVMAGIGAIAVWKSPHRAVIFCWLGAVGLYFVVLAGANAGHVYYQLPLLPVASLLAGFAVYSLMESNGISSLLRRSLIRRTVQVTLAAVLLGHAVLYFYFFSYMYDTTIRMPHVREVAGIIQERTSPDAVMVLNQPKASTTVLTYYSNRKSWRYQTSSGEEAIEELEDLRARGATLYVAVDTRYGSGMAESQKNEVLWRYLNDRYKAIALSEHYAIFDLGTTKDRERDKSQ